MLLATRRCPISKWNVAVYWLIIMSNPCPNLVAIKRKERLVRHIRFRYPKGYRFVRPGTERELNEMQDILVYEGFNEMRMCISFELYYVFFFNLEWGVVSSSGTIPPNHPGSIALIWGKNNRVAKNQWGTTVKRVETSFGYKNQTKPVLNMISISIVLVETKM